MVVVVVDVLEAVRAGRRTTADGCLRQQRHMRASMNGLCGLRSLSQTPTERTPSHLSHECYGPRRGRIYRDVRCTPLWSLYATSPHATPWYASPSTHITIDLPRLRLFELFFSGPQFSFPSLRSHCSCGAGIAFSPLEGW